MISRINILCLAAALAPLFATADPCGTVLVTHGLVEVVHARPHAILKANSGDVLRCGDFIITKGKTSSAVLEFSRGKMILGPKTRIEIASSEKAEEQALDKEVDAVNLIYGISRALITKRLHDGSPRFEIRTPAAIVGVRGTDFVVGHDSVAHTTREATLQGSVEVSRHGSKDVTVVTSGQQVALEEGSEKTPLTVSDMTPEQKIEIKTISRIAQYDPDFMHKEAVDLLGKPEDWERSSADDYRRAGWKGTEYQHQTDAKKFELTPLLAIADTKDSNALGSNSVASDLLFNFSVAGEYGINKMFSAGVKIGYVTEGMSEESGQINGKASGLIDPSLFFKGRNVAGPGLIRYGGVLSLSPAAHTWKTSGNSFSGNEFTGGITYNTFGGYEMLLGPGAIGGRLSFDLVQTDRKYTITGNGGDVDATVKGGQVVAMTAFYELPVNEWTWGADLGLVNYTSWTEVAQFNGTSVQMNSSGSQMRGKIEIYGTCRANDHLTVMATAGMGPAEAFIPNIQAANGGGIYGIAGFRWGL